MRRNLLAIAFTFMLLHIAIYKYHPMCAFDFATCYGRYFEDAKLREVGTAGYPIFVATLRTFFDDVIAGQLVSTLFSSLIVFPLYGIFRNYMNERMSLMGVIIVMLNPLMFRYSAISMSDMTGLFFFALACWMYLDKRYWLCGLAVGFGYWVRPELIMLAPLFVIASLISNRDFKPAFFISIPVVALFLQYALYVSLDRGSFTLTNKQSMLPDVSNYFLNLLNHSENILKYAGFPALVLGLWGMYKNKKYIIISAVFLLILPIFPILLIHGRYVMIPIFCLLMYAVYALSKTQYFKWGIVAMFIGYLPTYSEVSKPDEDMIYLKEAGLAIRSYVQPHDRVFDRKPYTAFYSGGIYEEMPDVPLDSLFTYGEKKGVKYIVASDVVLSYFRPQLRSIARNDKLNHRGNTYTTIFLDNRVRVWKKSQ